MNEYSRNLAVTGCNFPQHTWIFSYKKVDPINAMHITVPLSRLLWIFQKVKKEISLLHKMSVLAVQYQTVEFHFKLR